MNKHLQDIADEKLGFSFGESWRYSEDSLVSLLPILRKTSKKKNYLLLSESQKVEVRDTGNINRVEVYNGEKQPIFIRMGEIFTGKTQERTAIRSYVIMPKEKVQVEVRCVYASKGINTSADMKSGGVAPKSFDAMFVKASLSERGVDQSKVWGEVTRTSASMSSSTSRLKSNGEIPTPEVTPTPGQETYDFFGEDLKGNIDNFSKQIDHILEKVPYFDDQVGIATLDLKGVSGIECFDLPKSWEALREAIIRKEGEHLSKKEKDSPFEYKKEKAVKSVKKALLLDYEEKIVFKSKDYRVIALKGNGFVGELVELKDDLVHLSIIRK